MADDKLTKEECFRILDHYSDWNTGQKSRSHANGFGKKDEDRIYDSRRELILSATKRLAELAK